MAKQNAIPGVISYGYTTPSRKYIVDGESILIASVEIDPASRDAGNTTLRTTYLRAGLGLGKVTANGDYKEYDNGNSDGTETLAAILNEDVDVLDPAGNAITTPIMAAVVIGGYIDADEIIGIDAAGKTDLRNAGGWTLVEDA